MITHLTQSEQAQVPFDALLCKDELPNAQQLHQITIKGGKKLSGYLSLQGDKTVAVHILFTLLFIPKIHFKLRRFPQCEDALKVVDWIVTNKLAQISLFEDTLTFYCASYPAINDIKGINSIRSSICLLTPLTLLNHKIKFQAIGGCNFTERPIDQHLAMAKQFGIDISEDGESNIASKRIEPAKVNFDCSKSNVPSVGLTCHGIISAIIFKRSVTLTNISIDPSIIAVLTLVKKIYHVKLDKTKRNLEITAKQNYFKGNVINFEIPPDQTVAMTYLACTLVTGGTLALKEKNLFPRSTKLLLKKMNVVSFKSGGTTYFSTSKLKCPDYVICSQAPGIPTDSAPILAALFANIRGRTLIDDLVYYGRDSHIIPLKKMGFDVEYQLNKTIVSGGSPNNEFLKFFVPDIRAGAALVIAALTRDANTELTNIYQLNRGYVNIVNNLISLGADITWK